MKDTLSSIDVDADIIALTFFEDERPLRGHAGKLDWRMNGALSRLILDGTTTGKEGETIVISTDNRIRSPWLLLFGLGESKFFGPGKLQGLLESFIKTFSKLSFSRIAVTIPGSSLFSVENMAGAVKAEFSKAGLPSDSELIIIN